MSIEYRQMTIDDYPAMIDLWRNTPGVGLSKADERDNIRSFLEHNPSSCFTAYDGGRLIGTSLAGSDGRRGYLHHVVVVEEYRGQGVGTALVERTLEALEKLGIQKAHLFVFKENETGKRYWSRTGWKERFDLVVFSKDI